MIQRVKDYDREGIRILSAQHYQVKKMLNADKIPVKTAKKLMREFRIEKALTEIIEALDLDTTPEKYLSDRYLSNWYNDLSSFAKMVVY